MKDKDVVEEIQELRQLEAPELIELYRQSWGKEPRCKRKEWLWRRIAWRIQEQKYGGLSRTAKKKLEELIGQIQLPGVGNRRTVRGSIRNTGQSEPLVGTVLVRKWHNQEIRVHVQENGYEWNNVIYRSLSAVARAVTGSHWNGKLFFGLTERKKR